MPPGSDFPGIQSSKRRLPGSAAPHSGPPHKGTGGKVIPKRLLCLEHFTLEMLCKDLLQILAAKCMQGGFADRKASI